MKFVYIIILTVLVLGFDCLDTKKQHNKHKVKSNLGTVSTTSNKQKGIYTYDCILETAHSLWKILKLFFFSSLAQIKNSTSHQKV